MFALLSRSLHSAALRRFPVLPSSGASILLPRTSRSSPLSPPLPSHATSSADEFLRAQRRMQPAASSSSAAAAAAAAGSDSSSSLFAAVESLNVSHARSAAVLAARGVVVESVEKRGKLGQLWHDYGYVGVGTYLGVYVSTLGLAYILVSSGLVGPNQVMRLVEALGMREHFPADISPKSSSFLMSDRAAIARAAPPRTQAKHDEHAVHRACSESVSATHDKSSIVSDALCAAAAASACGCCVC